MKIPERYRLGIVKIPASKHVEPQDSPSAPGPVARLSIHHDAPRGGPRQRNAPHGRRHRGHRGILALAVLGREKTWENIGKNMGKTMGKYGKNHGKIWDMFLMSYENWKICQASYPRKIKTWLGHPQTTWAFKLQFPP